MQESENRLDEYNVVWQSPSQNSSESMPVGGRDIGLNVWVEDGDVLFYIGRSGTFDENNQMLKLGRVRLRIHPNPFTTAESFRQELKLQQGNIEITSRQKDGSSTKVDIWVEITRPVIHADVVASQPMVLEIVYENWRTTERDLPPGRQRHPAMSTLGYPGVVTTKPDVVEFLDGHIVFYHRNQTDALLFDKIVSQQGLESVRDTLFNPQIHRTFGGLVCGDEFVEDGTEQGRYIDTKHTGWRLRSKEASTSHHCKIVLHTSQCESLSSWLDELTTYANEAIDVDVTKMQTESWWKRYWDRSYVRILPDALGKDSEPWELGRNYALFRYMLGCNAYGEYPTKFNGGLFTTDPGFVESELMHVSPDFRAWGGGSFTAQNQRLVYWPMLKNGDFDMMESQFDFYLKILRNAELRTKTYWGHDGCSFTEQLENFGLPVGYEWGWMNSNDPLHRRTPFSNSTEQLSPWVRHLFINQLEFSFMILKYYQYSGRDISDYMPFIESSIRFFDEHYQYLHYINTGKRFDTNGNLVFFPSTAGETYKEARNPSDLIAGLRATVQAVLELPIVLLSEEKRRYYESLNDRLPSIPLRQMNGHNTIAPAESWSEIINVEIPQLYAVFPYELYGIGRDDLKLATDTWTFGVDTENQKDHKSWHQDNIFCARMGLTEEARQYTVRKMSSGPFRFPSFWGPGHDWVPDHNWGGSGMLGIQEMLLQTNGEKIYLLPAWPRDWDVDFKLSAPFQTTVEGKVRQGRLMEFVVTPESRTADVISVWDV
ncbi:DUF5703 domain-containing protein [Alicyclobacillus sp. SO9]|uniref:DUF5703 domain-containing protein n=1 Tax=Alicyclobacillus sp. SO9 TaxID=2665646 RepID=UPI0018E82658|nr:DUF5703 domain-containing protein [Alicyclobacillus sp. SO9]QQE77963.1 hypothetical protein GI364_18925 [Alicyclobacillus sp. SO9]